jgi:2-C-methyl-D-erythritol 4-phosphate cytidylyltransferase
MKAEKRVAIVLAAGQGKRMNTDIKKQYLLLANKPILYYSLYAFQKSNIIDEIILVTAEEDIEYCKTEIIEKYKMTKVKNIITGGKERYDSVYMGLKTIKDCTYVFIHDGARPFIKEEILKSAYENVKQTGACVVGVKSKDTVKIADPNDVIQSTPQRENVWCVQTPQVFSYKKIRNAYDNLMEEKSTGKIGGITDDAMVFERYIKEAVQLVWGGYENIKITTPEDLEIAEVFVKRHQNLGGV